MSKELDIEVAEKVMGWERCPNCLRASKNTWACDGCDYPIWWTGGRWQVTRPDGKAGHWSPFTDIAAAWEVVEEMIRRKYLFYIEHDGEYWIAFFDAASNSIIADTAPEAICLAALVAVRRKHA